MGFRAATLVAAACYGAALVHARIGTWGDRARDLPGATDFATQEQTPAALV
jgi:hypothetical protein